MSTLIKVEILKLKRYNILALGVFTTFGTVMIAVYQAWSMRFYGMDFSGIADFVLWDGLTLLMPFTITLIGGFILKRELTDHTMPAVLMVPVSESKLLAAKLIITAIVTEFLVLFEYIMTIGAAFMLGVGGSITGILLLSYFSKFMLIGLTTFIAVLPLFVVTAYFRKGYLGSTIVAFFMGFLGIMAANSPTFVNLWPLTTGLSLIDYRSSGAKYDYYNPIVSTMVLSLVLLFTVIMVRRTGKRKKDF